MSEIKRLLEEELVNEIGELGRMDLGSDEYKTTVDGIGKLMDRVNESEKIKLEAQEKEAIRLQDAEIKMEQIKQDKKNRWAQIGTTLAGLAIGTVVTIWGTMTTLKFEEEGTVTTTAGKSHIKNLFKK